MKKCSKCKRKLKLTSFSSNKYKADGKDHYCRSCRSDAGVDSHNRFKPGKRCKIEGCVEPYYAKEYCKLHYTRNWRGTKYRSKAKSPTYLRKPEMLKFMYGLTLSQYKLMLKNGCNICGDHGSVSSLQIDHDHSCCNSARSCGGCVRGVLCSRCNSIMSWYDKNNLRDNHPLIPSIEKYLEKYETRAKIA